MAEVTPREIDSIREAQEDFLPQRVIIRRRKFVGDGGFASQTVAEDVPCRIMPGFGQWATIADRFQGITAYRATFAHDVDVQDGDTIVDELSRTFEVRDVLAPSSYQTAKQALVHQVTEATDG